MMAEAATNNYEIGPYRLICDHGLFRGDELVYLPPKELAVLEALVSRQGAVASKDELIAAAWPDAAASEESLARCIYVLRKTLEINGEKFIQTLHRRGYRIAASVRPLPGPPNPPATPQFSNVEQAHEYYQRGLSRLNFRHYGDLQQAYRCFQQAIELDPGYKLAYFGLAEAMIVQTGNGWLASRETARVLDQIRDRVLEIDPDFGEVHALSAFTRASFDWDWERAGRDLARAAELCPEHHLVTFISGYLAHCRRQSRVAVERIGAAVERAPYIPHYREMHVWSLFADDRLDEALGAAREATRLMPSVSSVFSCHAAMASCAGEHAEAIAAAERCASLAEREPLGLICLISALHRGGREAEARATYAEIRERFATRHPIWGSVTPEVFLIEGAEGALDCLERSAADREFVLPAVLPDPRLTPLRDHPRFRAVEQMVMNAPSAKGADSVVALRGS